MYLSDFVGINLSGAGLAARQDLIFITPATAECRSVAIRRLPSLILNFFVCRQFHLLRDQHFYRFARKNIDQYFHAARFQIAAASWACVRVMKPMPDRAAVDIAMRTIEVQAKRRGVGRKFRCLRTIIYGYMAGVYYGYMAIMSYG